MGRFDFVSPGAAATESITKLLAERKAEERQRLLDSIAVQAEERANAQLQEQKRVHDASIASTQQQDKLARLGAITQNMDMGSDISSLPQDAQDLGHEFGAWQQQPQPSVSTEITGMSAEGQDLGGSEGSPFGAEQAASQVGSIPKPKWGYAGTKEEREKRRKDNRAGATIASLLGKKDTAQAGEFLGVMSGLYDGAIPERAAENALTPRSARPYDHATGKFGDPVPLGFGQEVIERTRPPRDYQPKSWFNTGYVDEKGPIIYNQDTGQRIDIPPDAHKGPDPNEGILGIDQGTLEAHSLQIGALLEGSDDISDSRLGTFRQSASNLIAKAKTTIKVKQLADVFTLDIPKYESLLRQAIVNDELDDREISHLRQLTNVIANPQVQETLRAHPFRPKKKDGPKPSATRSYPAPSRQRLEEALLAQR